MVFTWAVRLPDGQDFTNVLRSTWISLYSTWICGPMRFTISEKNVERIRAFLRKQSPGGNEEWKYAMDNLGRTTSPGYTMNDAIDELLTEAGF